METVMHPGQCLCGAISFTVSAPLNDPDACHCTQCRKQSGHYFSATRVAHEHLEIDDAAKVRWYRSSSEASRGFCDVCGSSLFWRPDGEDHLYVAMGAFDEATGTRLAQHIFTAHKGDYYRLDDGVPQQSGWTKD